MDIINLVVNCTDCSNLLVKPVVLPCGSSVCLAHLKNLKTRTYLCKSCEKDHQIDESYMNVNKSLEALINANFKHLNLGSEYKEASHAFKKLDEIMRDSETLRNEPFHFVKETIDRLRNKTELIREECKLKIDDKANEIVEQLDQYEAECKSNLDSTNFKTSLAKMNETISRIRQNLDTSKRALNNFAMFDLQLTTVKLTSNDWNAILNNQLLDFKKQLLLHKLNYYFTLVANFQEIELSSDAKLDIERIKYRKILKQLDTTDSKIIDDKKYNQLLKLCNFSPEQKWKLIYRASEHGFTAGDFHSKCDNVPNTLTIVKSTCGYIFGGYTSQKWDQSNKYKQDPGAFLFSLVNPQNEPVKLNVKLPLNAIFCGAKYGPTFGGNFHDLYIHGYSIEKNANYSRLGSAFPRRYCYYDNFLKSFTQSETFTVLDVDIYQIK